MNNKLLFVHIPKTAGTSFRKACQKYFGDEHSFYDYGTSSVETSGAILEHAYDKKDMHALYQEFEKYDNMFLSGHFPVDKYMHLFKTVNVITFVREPVAQVLSHFKHFQTQHDYSRSLHEFIKEDRFKNVQSRMLRAKPLELYGFIGLTEEYSKSIEMINAYYGVELESLKANVHADINFNINSLDKETVELIQRENCKDLELHEKAKVLFAKRERCFRNSIPYSHLLIQEKNSKFIRGCAFTKDQSDAANIEVCSGNRVIDAIQAKNFRPGLLKHRLPREGFVGFAYHFENDDEQNIFCRVPT